MNVSATRGRRFDGRDAQVARWTRGRVRVGNAIYHTVEDRKQAVEQLGLEYDQTYADLSHAIFPGAKPGFEGLGTGPNLVWSTWWKATAQPAFSAWAKFKSEQTTGDLTHGGDYAAYGNRFATDWPVYEDWHKRLVVLRDTAKLLGIPMTSPKPLPLPSTIVEDATDIAKRAGGAAAGAAGDVWTLAKVAVYGGLGILGAIAVGSLVSNMRSGKDPARPYLELARRR